MGAYRFTLTDLDGDEIGEIQDASTRWVEQQIKKTATAGFTIRATNDLIEELYAEDRRLLVHHYIAASDTEELVFHGPIISLEATTESGGPSVAVTAADPSFYFAKRVAGKRAEWNDTGSGIQGVKYTSEDKILIAKALIDVANGYGETGVDTGDMAANANVGNSTFIAGPYKLLDECIVELTDTADGFEWYIEPQAYAAGKIGSLQSAEHFALGAAKPNAVFEYGLGTRANVESFTYQRTWADLANRIFDMPQTLDLTPPDQVTDVLSPPDEDAASITEHGLYEALVEAGEITSLAMRAQLDQFHLDIRAQPRNILSFVPVVDPIEDGSMPVYGHDYSLGDYVPVRIRPEGKTLIEGNLRVYKMRIEIDLHGRVRYTPTTIPE